MKNGGGSQKYKMVNSVVNSETREDFGDLWCLGLVNYENGKV